MSKEMIYRDDAIDALCLACGHDCDKGKFVYNAPQDEQVIMCPEHYALSTLPSAQPEVRTEMSSADTIRRQAAIDAIDKCSVWVMYTQGDSQKDEAEFVENIIKQTKKAIQSMLKEDLPSAQPETHGKRTETHACDLIGRQTAIDELCDNCDHVEAVCPHYPCKQYIAIENLPPAQPEQSNTSEFWRKRADYYYDICSKLIADMGAGVKIEAVKIDETGITFTKKKPPTQQEINCSEIPNSSDTISRQLAIDVLDQIFGSIPMEQTTEILTFRRALRELPPAQPDVPDINVGDMISRAKAIEARYDK